MRTDPRDTHVMLFSGLHTCVLETEYIGALPAHINIQKGRGKGREESSFMFRGWRADREPISINKALGVILRVKRFLVTVKTDVHCYLCAKSSVQGCGHRKNMERARVHIKNV